MDCKLRIYLDNCCFSRPFDDQSRLTVRLEAEAVLFIQKKVRRGEIDLVWSYVLDFESLANPFLYKSDIVKRWQNRAICDIEETEEILLLAESYERLGLKSMDALHLACANVSQCKYFVTTDLRILNKNIPELSIINPVQFVKLFEEY